MMLQFLLDGTHSWYMCIICCDNFCRCGARIGRAVVLAKDRGNGLIVDRCGKMVFLALAIERWLRWGSTGRIEMRCDESTLTLERSVTVVIDSENWTGFPSAKGSAIAAENHGSKDFEDSCWPRRVLCTSVSSVYASKTTERGSCLYRAQKMDDRPSVDDTTSFGIARQRSLEGRYNCDSIIISRTSLRIRFPLVAGIMS